jgi:hypothetical protein
MHQIQICTGREGSWSFFKSRQFLPVAMYSPWKGKSIIACPMDKAKNAWKAANK